MDEVFDKEQKEVIQIMQDQIQAKVKEVLDLKRVNEELNGELCKAKMLIAKEKEKGEDFDQILTQVNTQKKRAEDQLIAKMNEVETLKADIIKMKLKYEQEVKKIKKAQQQKVNSQGTNNNNLTTGGSNDIVSARARGLENLN